jgi:hypothetical protein
MADLYLGNTGLQANSISPVSGSVVTINGLVISSGTIVSGQSVQTQNRFNATLSGNTAGVMAQISSGTLTLAGGNNITLSQNGNAVSIIGGAGGGGGAGLSAGTQSVSTGTVNFANSNGITFGMSGSSQITASHNGLTSQSNQALSGSNGSFTFQTATFGNLNGMSFYTSNGSLVGSYTVPSQTVQTQNMVSVNGSTGNISFATGSSLSSSSNGSTITFGLASNITTALQSAGAYLTTAAQSNHSHAFSASGGSSNFQTLNFANSNGITFSNSNGSVIASHNGLTTAMASNRGTDFVQANAAFAGTNASGTIASSGISISVAAGGGGGADGWNEGQFTNSTANSTMPILWAGNSNGSGNITMGLTGSTVTASAPSGGGGTATATLWYPYNEGVNVMGQQGNATWHFAPVPTPLNRGDGIVSFDQAVFPMLVTNATNSTGTVTVSISMGLYTKTESSLSLAHTASGSFAVTFSGTVNNSTYAGIRLATIPFNTTFEGGRYYAGIAYRSTTGGANATVSQVLVSQLNSNFSGNFGVASNRSNQWPMGLGVRSASSSGFFSSIAFSQIDGTASLVARPPSWHMRLGTA